MKKLLPLPQSPNNPIARGRLVFLARITDASISTSAAVPRRSAARTRPPPGSGTVSAMLEANMRSEPVVVGGGVTGTSCDGGGGAVLLTD